MYIPCRTVYYPKVFNPVAWYDGDDPNGTGLKLANDAAITTWADKSGNNYNAIQLTGANQPIYKASLYNGRGAVQFSGNQYMDVAYNAALNPASFTLILVCAVTGGSGFRSPITSRDPTPTTKGYLIYAHSDGTWNFWVGTNVSNVWNQISDGTATLSQLYMLIGQGNTASNPFVVNGTPVSGDTTNYTQQTVNQLRIGAGGETASFFFIGNVCDILLFNSVSPSYISNKIKFYERIKWANGIS